MRHGLEVGVPQEAHRGHGTGRQGRARARRPEVLRRHAHVGAVRRRRRRSTSSCCPPSTATSTRRTAEMIPFERQFQTLHSLQNYFLLNELLAPGPADADRRHRGAAARRARRSWRRSPSGPTTSSGPRRRRCCSTKSTGSSSGRCGPSPTPGPTRSRTRSRCSAEHGSGARPIAGGTDLVIRLRDGSIRPDVVVDVKRIRELEASIRESDGRVVIGARAVMTDIATDPLVRRHFPALAEAALGRRRRADPQPRDARGQPVQRVAGRGHGTGAAGLRRVRRGCRTRAASDGSRSTSSGSGPA